MEQVERVERATATPDIGAGAGAGFPYADRVRTVTPRDVVGWLWLGWQDMRAAGPLSLAYGALFVAIGFALTGGLAMLGMGYLIAPLIGGFLLVAPLLALGLYRISKDVEEGRRPRLLAAVTAWRANPYHILTAGLVLMLYVMIWTRLNVVAFALFFPHEAINMDRVLEALLTVDGLVFAGFVTALGFAFAAFAFIINVTALPMMLDRPVDIFAAALVSAIAVVKNPQAMALWGGLIVLITGLGFATAFLGLIVALPLIGHASWHAYRALVKEEGEA